MAEKEMIEYTSCPRCGGWMGGFTPYCNDCYEELTSPPKKPESEERKED